MILTSCRGARGDRLDLTMAIGIEVDNEDPLGLTGLREGVLQKGARVAGVGCTADALRSMQMAQGYIVESIERIGRDTAGAANGQGALGVAGSGSSNKGMRQDDVPGSGMRFPVDVVEDHAQGRVVVVDVGVVERLAHLGRLGVGDTVEAHGPVPIAQENRLRGRADGTKDV